MSALTTTDFPTLSLLCRGKVRDIYLTSNPERLLFVATDRISAYDVILRNVRPDFVLSPKVELTRGIGNTFDASLRRFLVSLSRESQIKERS
jgi:hypothetical protein